MFILCTRLELIPSPCVHICCDKVIPNENKLELAVEFVLSVCVVCGTYVKINYFRWNLKAEEQVTFHEKQLSTKRATLRDKALFERSQSTEPIL